MIGKNHLGTEIKLRMVAIDEDGSTWEVRLGLGNEGYGTFFLPVRGDRNENMMRVAFAVSDVMQKIGQNR